MNTLLAALQGKVGPAFGSGLALLILCAASVAAAPAPNLKSEISNSESGPAWTGTYDLQPLDATRPATQPATAATSAGPAAPAASDFGITRVALALGAVLLVILAARAAAKRFLPTAAAGADPKVKVLSRTPIAPRQQIVLLQIGRRVVVVGDSGGRLAALAEIADPDEVAALLGRSTIPSDSLEAVDATDATGSAFARLIAGRRDAYDDSARTDAAGGEAQQELGGLADRVKLLSAQFRRG